MLKYTVKCSGSQIAVMKIEIISISRQIELSEAFLHRIVENLEIVMSYPEYTVIRAGW